MANEMRIGRRVYTTICKCIMYDDENNCKELEVEIIGNPNEIERATTKVQKMLGTKRVMVHSMTTKSRYYSMPTEKFIELSDKITD